MRFVYVRVCVRRKCLGMITMNLSSSWTGDDMENFLMRSSYLKSTQSIRRIRVDVARDRDREREKEWRVENAFPGTSVVHTSIIWFSLVTAAVQCTSIAHTIHLFSTACISEIETIAGTLAHKQFSHIIIEVLIFIYLSFVRLLLYNKHLIDV